MNFTSMKKKLKKLEYLSGEQNWKKTSSTKAWEGYGATGTLVNWPSMCKLVKITWENRQYLLGLNHICTYPMTQQSSLQCIPQRNADVCSLKDIVNVHRSTLCNNPNLETGQMPVSGRIDECSTTQQWEGTV